MTSTTISYILLSLLLAAGVLFSVKRHKLTRWAAFTGALTALLLYMATGFAGVLMMTAFFIIGTAATSHKKHLKQSIDSNSAPRDTWQVLANSGTAAILTITALLFPAYKNEMLLMIAGAFATAAADTASSELGVIYGRNFYNIISWKRDTRGLDGVISLEGTLLGLAGSFLIALIYGLFAGLDWAVVAIALAGAAGNLADSLLGAVLERRQLIDNNMVNFLATLTGAVTAAIIA